MGDGIRAAAGLGLHQGLATVGCTGMAQTAIIDIEIAQPEPPLPGRPAGTGRPSSADGGSLVTTHARRSPARRSDSGSPTAPLSRLPAGARTAGTPRTAGRPATSRGARSRCSRRSCAWPAPTAGTIAVIDRDGASFDAPWRPSAPRPDRGGLSVLVHALRRVARCRRAACVRATSAATTSAFRPTRWAPSAARRRGAAAAPGPPGRRAAPACSPAECTLPPAMTPLLRATGDLVGIDARQRPAVAREPAHPAHQRAPDARQRGPRLAGAGARPTCGCG